jgi:serine protease inhibitor
MFRKGVFCAPTIIILWVYGFSSEVSSAPPHRTGANQTFQEQVARVVKADNRFAFDLYQRLRTEKGNLFFSPASISIALAMTYAGAAGTTETQMAKTLHFTMAKAQLNAEIHALRNSWSTNDKKRGFRLEMANRLWGQEGYHFLGEFLRVNRTDYGAELG